MKPSSNTKTHHIPEWQRMWLIPTNCLASCPFTDNHVLYSLVTGVTTDVSISVDQASEVGAKILQNMIGKRVAQHSYKRKEQVIPLCNNNAVKMKDNIIDIDPQLLFQTCYCRYMEWQYDDSVWMNISCAVIQPCCLRTGQLPGFKRSHSLALASRLGWWLGILVSWVRALVSAE